ncbi:hypothetical protein E4K72_15195 [Oxalobacteraceae bacterium OM1]|nr:hypothetical protein E4K72_15195 [Oxalobacteraceae bacterium OM1]
MWKLMAAFAVFALTALLMLMKNGDNLQIQGEGAAHEPATSAPATPANGGTPMNAEASTAK